MNAFHRMAPADRMPPTGIANGRPESSHASAVGAVVLSARWRHVTSVTHRRLTARCGPVPLCRHTSERIRLNHRLGRHLRRWRRYDKRRHSSDHCRRRGQFRTSSTHMDSRFFAPARRRCCVEICLLAGSASCSRAEIGDVHMTHYSLAPGPDGDQSQDAANDAPQPFVNACGSHGGSIADNATRHALITGARCSGVSTRPRRVGTGWLDTRSALGGLPARSLLLQRTANAARQ